MIMFSRLLVVAGLLALQAVAGDGVDAAWKNLQSLEGEWQGAAGKAGVTYTIVSGGSVVMERMKMPAPQPDMVTMYHRDGGGLVATHYCSMGNQPRMRGCTKICVNVLRKTGGRTYGRDQARAGG